MHNPQTFARLKAEENRIGGLYANFRRHWNAVLSGRRTSPMDKIRCARAMIRFDSALLNLEIRERRFAEREEEAERRSIERGYETSVSGFERWQRGIQRMIDARLIALGWRKHKRGEWRFRRYPEYAPVRLPAGTLEDLRRAAFESDAALPGLIALAKIAPEALDTLAHNAMKTALKDAFLRLADTPEAEKAFDERFDTLDEDFPADSPLTSLLGQYVRFLWFHAESVRHFRQTIPNNVLGDAWRMAKVLERRLRNRYHRWGWMYHRVRLRHDGRGWIDERHLR